MTPRLLAITLIFLWPLQGVSQAPASPMDQLAAPAEATPKGEAPTIQPPPPPAELPAPPKAAQPPPAQPGEQGQWVYTSQYGWVWIPYGDDYVYTPLDEAAEPDAYLYYPGYGWGWYAAPWIWGLGPLPFFGSAGPWRFHWYRGPAYHPRSPERPLFHGGYVQHSAPSHTGGHAAGHGGGHGGHR